MSELIRSALLDDSAKTKLTEYDLFDKVINLKITTATDSFVIRSDYEVVYKNLTVDNAFRVGNIVNTEYYIQKCQHKPSIKVQYKRVSTNTGIAIDIYINNFYILTDKGEALLSFNNSDRPIELVEITMGYFGQFSQLPHETFEQLQELKTGYGIQKLTCSVEYVTTDKLPPDSVLHIHGWVGSMLSSNLSELAADKFSKLTNSALISNVSVADSGGKSFLEEMFYSHITKRFVKYSGYKREVKQRLVEGLMTDEDAEKYGIQIYCSSGVKELSRTRAKPKIDADGNAKPFSEYFSSGYSARNVFNKINTAMGGNLGRAELNNGNWLVFTLDETEDQDKLRKEFQEYLVTEGTRYYGNKLPAVYNISVADLTTIVAPFYFFLNPFEEVYFKSRYSLSSLVNYYANQEGMRFLSIQQMVSFATVDNLNEMTLVCNKQE